MLCTSKTMEPVEELCFNVCYGPVINPHFTLCVHVSQTFIISSRWLMKYVKLNKMTQWPKTTWKIFMSTCSREHLYKTRRSPPWSALMTENRNCDLKRKYKRDYTRFASILIHSYELIYIQRLTDQSSINFAPMKFGVDVVNLIDQIWYWLPLPLRINSFCLTIMVRQPIWTTCKF